MESALSMLHKHSVFALWLETIPAPWQLTATVLPKEKKTCETGTQVPPPPYSEYQTCKNYLQTHNNICSFQHRLADRNRVSGLLL